MLENKMKGINERIKINQSAYYKKNNNQSARNVLCCDITLLSTIVT